jgi:uncharacterized membrane protein YecN with MAPEG domain
MFTKIRNYIEYIPIFLIVLLFVTEHECKNHIKTYFCSLMATIIALILMYILLIYVKMNKKVAFAIITLLWIVLIYSKKNFLIFK